MNSPLNLPRPTESELRPPRNRHEAAKRWLTVRELLGFSLPYLPKTTSGMSRLIRRERWRSQFAPQGARLARRRGGLGPFEYHITILPWPTVAELQRRRRRELGFWRHLLDRLICRWELRR